jgi:hypothetical protein
LWIADTMSRTLAFGMVQGRLLKSSFGGSRGSMARNHISDELLQHVLVGINRKPVGNLL